MIAFKICLNLAVRQDICKAENKFLGKATKLVANIFYLPQKLVHVYLISKNQRVEAPNYCALAKFVYKQFECLDTLFKFWHAQLQSLLFVIIKGVLDIATNPSFP